MSNTILDIPYLSNPPISLAHSGSREEEKMMAEFDKVNRPEHYQTPGGLQPVDVVENFDCNLHVGQAVIYLLRLGKKDPIEIDLPKAIWWLVRFAKRHLGITITVDADGNVNREPIK